MVGVFRRSLSFPNKNPNRPSQKPPISHHIRSISLPCRSHPLISQIKDEINDLTIWASISKSHLQTSTNLSHGLTLLKDTHETLRDILQLPQTRESFRSNPTWVEKLLEDFLRFVEAYGMFQTSILALKEEHSSAQMATRKRDESKVVVYLKAKKKMAKEMEKLVSGVRCVTQQHQQYGMLQQVPVSLASNIEDNELGRVIADVMSVTVSVSVALFNGIAMSFSSRRLSTWTQMIKLCRKGRRVNKEHEGIEEFQEQESLGNLKKKGDEEVRSLLKRMRDLEGCICGIETVSDKVFRALINSRVALLNTLTLTQ
ncbi:uncharacterized protein LOC133315236 [Gastrolobium bilobum]|uniref:uncharacterized protein LOC133315236 n=1 Tax=Gastrolobium bilobum TaxID=150636 RepID=UPI002AB2E4A7|nr:uncharacterized protein LOC133315236 [Gastrolobium bilobum]